jgi:protein-tyrosine phosphatase
MNSYHIEGPWPGQLAIVPRPRGGDWLTDELRSLKDEGFDVLVSLLTEAESEELGLVHEADLCREKGLAYFNFPIPDLGVPESGPKAQRFVGELHRALVAGKKVAVHCRQGIGRSGLIAASLLVTSGMDPESAFRRVSVARGLSTPETVEQKNWVVELARELIEPLLRS